MGRSRSASSILAKAPSQAISGGCWWLAGGLQLALLTGRLDDSSERVSRSLEGSAVVVTAKIRIREWRRLGPVVGDRLLDQLLVLIPEAVALELELIRLGSGRIELRELALDRTPFDQDFLREPLVGHREWAPLRSAPGLLCRRYDTQPDHDAGRRGAASIR